MSSAASLGILEWLESVGKPVYSSEFSLCTVTWGHTKSQTSLVDDILLSLMNKYWTWPQEIDPLLVKIPKSSSTEHVLLKYRWFLGQNLGKSLSRTGHHEFSTLEIL